MKSFGFSLAFTIGLLGAGASTAQVMDKNVKIGSLGDQSSIAANLAGVGSIAAAKMAVEDSGLRKEGWNIEVISADHQNKADIAATIARQWVDVDKVDAFIDLGNSSVALMASHLAHDKNVVALVSGAASSELTGAQCTPNTIHWVYDTYLLSHAMGEALVKKHDDTWFFVTSDYAFGRILERETSEVVIANGGRVLGAVKHPPETSDFGSFLLQAQASGAKVVAFSSTGQDITNAIRQAVEFGLTSGGQTLAGMLMAITDINTIGLPTAQGLYLTETFYWDMNDETRAFTKRFNESYKRSPPTMPMAGAYSSTLHYLKALKALGGNPHDGAKVVAKMKEIPTDDPLFGKGYVRADGRKMHPAYLFEVKKPSESKYPWDFYNTIETIPPEKAFRLLSESSCPLVKK